MDPSQVPVFINSFNQPTYLEMMLSQLRAVGCRNLIVLDQASTYPPLLKLLDDIERDVTVIRMRDNNGPHWMFTSGLSTALPEYFIYTDPDIRFPVDMPGTLVSDLMRVMAAARATKVGLALDISEPEKIKKVVLPIGGSAYSIPEWERQFWRRPIRFRGFEVYKAPVDTTFALYHRSRFDGHVRRFRAENAYYCMDMPGSYRLAGRYTSVHLPWMLDDPIPPEELAHYVANRRNIHQYLG